MVLQPLHAALLLASIRFVIFALPSPCFLVPLWISPDVLGATVHVHSTLDLRPTEPFFAVIQ